MKIKANDTVVITTGKDKGKKGKVMRTYQKTNKIVVEKVNIRTKHIKKRSERAGEKIQFEASIDASNAKVICPACNKPVRVGYKVPKAEGHKSKKYRICKKCEASLDIKTTK